MNIKTDTLYKIIDSREHWYKCEAKKHRKMHRLLWLASAVLSLLVAIFANFKFNKYGVSSDCLTALLSIILPVVTGYTVLRSPENLWILETGIRNKLRNLASKMLLESERNPDFNREPYEKEYLAVMREANQNWLKLKNAEGNA